jgi:hypothetical protein
VYKLNDANILAAKLIMDKDNVPSENRYMLIPPSMLADILAIDKFVEADKYGSSNVPMGWVGRIYGMNVIMRSRTIVFDGSDAIKDTEAATAATDTSAAVIWHPMAVRTAIGSIKPFLSLNRPEFHGDIFSAAVRFGGLAARNDNKGIVVIREDAN